jgi:DNA-binding NtrC family response regulator
VGPSQVEPLPFPVPRQEWLELPWKQVRHQVLESAELHYLTGILDACQGRIGQAARRAGMDPRSLFQKMQRYGLRKEDFRPKAESSKAAHLASRADE